jgi:hypothetical protein
MAIFDDASQMEGAGNWIMSDRCRNKVLGNVARTLSE